MSRDDVCFLEGSYFTDTPIVLTPEDSGCGPTDTARVTWTADKSAVLFGGVPIDPQACKSADCPSCGSTQLKSAVRWDCKLPPVVGQAKSVSVNNSRATPARFPDFDPTDPFEGGWLFVNTTWWPEENTVIFGVETALLPGWLTEPTWRGQISIFATRSWLNFENPVKAVSRANAPDASQSLSYFVVSSPHISNVSLGQSVGPGNRFFFFDTADAVSVTNEWAIDTNTGLLSILLEAGVTPADVVVASTATIVQLAGRVVDGRPQQTQDYVRHVTLRGLGFTSTSYTAQGFQSGFNVVPGQGLPDDAAVLHRGLPFRAAVWGRCARLQRHILALRS